MERNCAEETESLQVELVLGNSGFPRFSGIHRPIVLHILRILRILPILRRTYHQEHQEIVILALIP